MGWHSDRGIDRAFPTVEFHSDDSDSRWGHSKHSFGRLCLDIYATLGLEPHVKHNFPLDVLDVEVDTTRLAIELVFTLVVLGGLLVVLRNGKSDATT